MKRGFSLLEIMIYAGLALVIGIAAFSVMSLGRRAGDAAAMSYSLARDVDTAVRIIREDLRATSVNSVRISMNPPGITFRSATDESGLLQTNFFGVPAWRSYVYYVLDVQPGGATANLVRWEQDAPAIVPDPSQTAVGPPATRKRHIVLRDVVAPGASSPAGPADPQSGGFVVRFVRSYGDGTEDLSDRNPVDWSREGGTSGNRKAIEGNTSMLEVRLTAIENRQDASAPNCASLRFRVRCRY